jgi:hypothetical protein
VAIDYGQLERRKVVAWFRSAAPEDAEKAFAQRNFIVQSWQEPELANDVLLSGATAVVFTQKADRPTEVASDLGRYGARILDLGCNVIVRPLGGYVRSIANIANDGRLPIAGLQDEVRDIAAEIGRWQKGPGDPPRPHLHLYFPAVPWRDIANDEMEHPAGPPPFADLRILPTRGAPPPDAGFSRLAKRAFRDCREIHLAPLPGGKSGASVFLAFADVRGTWSMPFFVKMGERGEIFEEYRKYEDHVDAYVPFHLGPNLDYARCFLGAHDGLLVGDFVEESESLLDCARDGRASPAIACLFERTLRGWHGQVEDRPEAPAKVFPFPDRLGPSRWLRARDLGAARALDDLRATLDGCATSRFLCGRTHGDLHASNVRVRGAEAILIDFLQCGEGPLIRDAAALEASLFVGSLDLTSNVDPWAALAEQAGRFSAWRASLEPLYREDVIRILPASPRPQDRWAWFHLCVRQIRMHAFHMEREPGQYALALAAALLFKAGKDDDVDEPERSTRALAYVYGEQLLVAAARGLNGAVLEHGEAP